MYLQITSVTPTLMFLLMAGTSGQMYPGDCEKYCDKDCSNYFNDGSNEFSRCVTANVECDCSRGGTEETVLIIILIIVTIFACVCCVMFKNRDRCAGNEGRDHNRYPVIDVLPNTHSPGAPSAPPMNLVQTQIEVQVDLPPPSYSEATQEQPPAWQKTFTDSNSNTVS